MVMFEEDDETHFPLYWTDDPMTIDDFNYGFLSKTKREFVVILEEFPIMSSKEMVEHD